MALFTLAELASYLQRDLDTATATLAQEVATGLVIDACGIIESDSMTLVLPIDVDTWRVELPTTVVTAVTSVVVAGVTLAAGTDYDWHKPYPWIQLYTMSLDATTFWRTATVTATLGYGAGHVPGAAKAVALSVAGRVYDNPAGLRSESVDDYSSTRAGADDDLAGITLTQAELNALARLRPQAFVTGTRR